jgi:hypothetical protein
MTVSSSTSRVQFNGNGSTTVFAYSFKIFDEDDLTVIVRSANGTETVKTITTHYTVSGVGNAGGGNVTMLTAPASGETLTILREQDLVQELDLVENDPFPSQSVEDALDKLTFIVQQHDEELGRAIKASRTNTISGSEFTVSAADRANKVFAFDSSGNVSIAQELGTYRGNWAAGTAYNQRDLIKDTSNDNVYICLVAHTSTGSQPISSNADVAKWALIVDAAAAATSASAASSSASAAASSASAASSSASAASSSASAASTSASNASSSASAAATSASNAAASYDSFDDRYLGAKSTGSGDPTVDNDGNALIDGALFFDTTNNVMKVYNLGTTTWLRTTPTSGDQANINTVSGIAANITTVAGIAANVTTVAGNSANVTTVAGISANVTTVAGISSDVTTVAANVAGVTSFAEKYRVGSADPSTSLDSGDLFYNTSSNLLKVYNGTAWETGVTPGSGFLSASNNLSDVSSVDTARTNLGLGSASSVTFAQVDITGTGDLRLQDTTGGQFVALQAPGTVATSFTLTLPAADGTNGQFLKTDGSGALSFGTVSVPVSYPQESKTANYTLVLADAGKQLFHPASDANIRTFTIPANSSVPFPIGTVLLFTQENGGNYFIKVDINSDTLVTNKSITGSVFVDAGNTLYCVKVSATKWLGYYLYQSAISPGPLYYLAVSHDTTPFVTVYPWSSLGFGAKYADPATLPTGSGQDVAFSPAANAIAVGHDQPNSIKVYPWSNSGFGTKYNDPGTFPAGDSYGVEFSPSGDAIAMAHSTSPRVSAYPWNSSTGFGTKFSNPGTLPDATSYEVAFSPSGNALAVVHGGSGPFVTVYAWSGSGFGTKFSNPATAPASIGFGVKFSPSGDAIAVAHASSPFISVYPWSGSGFGAKYSNPATLPASQGNGVAFSPAGDALAVAHDSSPNISVYPWSGSGFGTKFSNPATLPAGDGRGVEFSPDGNAIALAHNSSPFISVYPWSGSGFGSKYSNPATLPASTGRGVSFGQI